MPRRIWHTYKSHPEPSTQPTQQLTFCHSYCQYNCTFMSTFLSTGTPYPLTISPCKRELLTNSYCSQTSWTLCQPLRLSMTTSALVSSSFSFKANVLMLCNDEKIGSCRLLLTFGQLNDLPHRQQSAMLWHTIIKIVCGCSSLSKSTLYPPSCIYVCNHLSPQRTYFSRSSEP